MKPWMLAVMSGAPQLVSKTYASGQPVSIPLGVSRLESLVGEGADGAPAYTQQGYSYFLRSVQEKRLRSTGEWVETFSMNTIGFSAYYPSSGCGPSLSTPDDPTYSSVRSCSYYSNIRSDTNYVPATTGAAASGFGKTSPGGAGGPATPTLFEGVPVVGGQSYDLVIPAGGFITISYYL